MVSQDHQTTLANVAAIAVQANQRSPTETQIQFLAVHVDLAQTAVQNIYNSLAERREVVGQLRERLKLSLAIAAVVTLAQRREETRELGPKIHSARLALTKASVEKSTKSRKMRFLRDLTTALSLSGLDITTLP